MVPVLAKNAVIIKCGYPNACMVGNYECAYGLGILAADSGQEKNYSIKNISELKKQIFDGFNGYSPEDEKGKRLLAIVTEYEPEDAFDKQMVELYNMGYEDEKIKN